MRGIIVIALAGVIGLSGCRTVVTKPVTVTRTVYVPVSPALRAHCPIASPRNSSGKELLRVARERKHALEVCNGQLDSIGLLQGTEVKP